jgi:hypothetical protein
VVTGDEVTTHLKLAAQLREQSRRAHLHRERPSSGEHLVTAHRCGQLVAALLVELVNL